MVNQFIFKEFIRQHIWRYVLGIVFVIVSSMLQLSIPKVIGYIIDNLRNTTATQQQLFWWTGSILGIVSNMFEENIEEMNAEVTDAVGELTNMISGQARRKLEETGRKFEAAIPSVVTGKNHKIRHFTSGPIIAVPFSTDGGTFTIEICFEKN